MMKMTYGILLLNIIFLIQMELQIHLPDSNTNMFNWFSTSLLAAYLLLTGNNNLLNLLLSFNFKIKLN